MIAERHLVWKDELYPYSMHHSFEPGMDWSREKCNYVVKNLSMETQATANQVSDIKTDNMNRMFFFSWLYQPHLLQLFWQVNEQWPPGAPTDWSVLI